MFAYCLNCPTSYIDEDGQGALALVAKWALTVVPTSVSLGPIGWFAVGVIGLTFVVAVVVDVVNYTSTATAKSKSKTSKTTRAAQKIAGQSTTASPPPPGSNNRNNSKLSIRSLIGTNRVLSKEAGKLTGHVQEEADKLITSFINGNKNPGLGTKHLSGNIYYLRGSNGARVFYRVVGTTMEILGKATKSNEQTVIDLVLELFGG